MKFYPPNMLYYMCQGKLLWALLFLFLAPLARASELDGSWSTSCLQGAQREEVFSGNQVSLFERNFLDYACTKPGLEVESAGDYLLDQELLADGLRTIDFSFRAVRVKALSAEYLSYLQTRKMCGITDWKIAEAKDISGLACEFYGPGHAFQAPRPGDLRYGIFHLEGDQLWFGQNTPELNGLTRDTRPRALQGIPYNRK